MDSPHSAGAVARDSAVARNLFALGGSVEPIPDPQSPFYAAFEWVRSLLTASLTRKARERGGGSTVLGTASRGARGAAAGTLPEAIRVGGYGNAPEIASGHNLGVLRSASLKPPTAAPTHARADRRRQLRRPMEPLQALAVNVGTRTAIRVIDCGMRDSPRVALRTSARAARHRWTEHHGP